MPSGRGSWGCGPSSLRPASTPGRSRSPGTSSARACWRRPPRPSAASSTPPGWSCRSRASARAAPGTASRPRRPTSCGSRTSPTGAWPTGPRSRSARGSTTTPATCSGARSSAGSAATTWWPPSPRPARLTAGPRPRSPTTAPSTRPASLGAATASSTCSPTSASARRTGRRGTPRPRARSSASTRPSSAGSGRGRRRRASRRCRTGSTPSRRAYNEERPHRAVGRATPGAAYRATPRALPAGPHPARAHFRLRYDVADGKGAVTLRRAGRLHHLNVGAAHARRRVLAIVDEQEVTVVALDTRRDPLDPPDRARPPVLAQPTERPRPMAGVPLDRLITCVADVATHVSPMSRLKTVVAGTGFEPVT